MKNVGVILAAGKGIRFADPTPKQFLTLAGKTILEHTIETFQRCDVIHEIAVVSAPEHIAAIENIVNLSGFNKVRKILSGGQHRHESSLAAVSAYKDEDCATDINLIFHDAVRPLVQESTIIRVVNALHTFSAVDVAIPATDTIIRVDGDDTIAEIPRRDCLRIGQTPQGFRLKTISRAYERARNDPLFQTTDDCGVVKTYLPREPIIVVEGSVTNIKITYESDVFLADQLFQLRRADLSAPSDLSQLDQTAMVVFGGSSGIGRHIVDLGRRHGAHVCSYSRSANGVDIRHPDMIRNALKEAAAKMGRIDFVVNTAAVLLRGALRNMDYADIHEMVAVNYLGSVHVAKESRPYLERSKGQLLLFTSSSFTRGRSSYSIYASTKASVVNFVQAIADEWKPMDIRVNCINPQRTRTPMRTKNFGNEPLATLLDPEDVARVSLSTLLSQSTGQIVYVTR